MWHFFPLSFTKVYYVCEVCAGDFVGAQPPQQPTSANAAKALEKAKLLASNVNRARNLGAEATDITQQAAAALLKGGKLHAPQVSVSS